MAATRKVRSFPAARTLAQTNRYGLSRWDGRARFLDDGRVGIG